MKECLGKDRAASISTPTEELRSTKINGLYLGEALEKKFLLISL